MWCELFKWSILKNVKREVGKPIMKNNFRSNISQHVIALLINGLVHMLGPCVHSKWVNELNRLHIMVSVYQISPHRSIQLETWKVVDCRRNLCSDEKQGSVGGNALDLKLNFYYRHFTAILRRAIYSWRAIYNVLGNHKIPAKTQSKA